MAQLIVYSTLVEGFSISEEVAKTLSRILSMVLEEPVEYSVIMLPSDGKDVSEVYVPSIYLNGELISRGLRVSEALDHVLRERLVDYELYPVSSVVSVMA